MSMIQLNKLRLQHLASCFERLTFRDPYGTRHMTNQIESSEILRELTKIC